MSLSKVLEEIKKVKPHADEDCEVGPIETLNGRRGRKRAAIEQLKTLKRQYTDELRRSAAFILVTGSARDSFTNIATQEFKCFSADPEAIYKELANRISPALYQGRDTVGDLFDVLGRHLEDKAGEIGIVGYPQLIFKQQYRRNISNKEEFAELVKQALNEQVGGEIVGINAVHTLTNEAIERNHSARVTPIILSSSDEKLVVDLSSSLERLTSRVFVVTAGKSSKAIKASVPGVISIKEPTNESVEQALTTISETIKK